MIPVCTELVDVFLLNLVFQLVLGTKFIQESNTVMTLVLLKIVELEIKKSEYFLFLFIYFNIGLMVGFKAWSLEQVVSRWCSENIFLNLGFPTFFVIRDNVCV